MRRLCGPECMGPALALVVLVAPTVRAQPGGIPVPVDTAGLAQGSRPLMSMRLEKTLFKVDVLTLELRFGPSSSAALRSIGSRQARPEALYESVARVAITATDVWARVRFLRDISLRQFLDAARESLRGAHEAGLIDGRAFASISDGLPLWYAFLEERRVLRGDEMHYRIRGDSLRTVYVGHDGRVLLDQLDVGPERRLSVLGGYFAAGSDFRRPLIRSLLFGAR